MPPTHDFDVVVLGRSLTGTLAAMRLRQEGRAVCLAPYASDNGSIEQLVEVPPSPLNARAISGEQFAGEVRKRIADLGIHEDPDLGVKIERDGDGLVVRQLEGGSIRSRKVVFAPAGMEDDAAHLGAAAFFGIGVSMDALSDAPLLSGKGVAVRGAGCRAAEQALLALKGGVRHVNLIPEGVVPTFGALSEIIEHHADIQVWRDTTIRALEASPSGQLSALRVERAGLEERIATDWLFLAQGLTCDWSAVSEVRQDPGIVLAGLANGIRYDDYPGMIADVARAVSAVSAA
jgi:thioredoxin reductase